MTHELARELISTALDEALDATDAAALADHLAGCGPCRGFQAGLVDIRRAVRAGDDEVPPIAAAVIAAVEANRRAPPRRWWMTAAAVFVMGAVLGAAFVGLRRPAEVAAGDVPFLVLRAQRGVGTLTARIDVVERGWHPQVPERLYSGTLAYVAPESLHLALRDLTDYPGGEWTPNDITLVVDGARIWTQGLLPCPTNAQPTCSADEPVLMGTISREPFPDEAPVPLDMVVPVASFTGSAEPEALGIRRESGRRLVGVAVTAAQIDPLLAGFRSAGNLREVYPADRAELWLDQRTLAPVRLAVLPADGPDRALWAQRRGYVDTAGVAILEIGWTETDVNGPDPGPFPPAPPGTPALDAGFDEGSPGVSIRDLAIPRGMEQYRSGATTTRMGPAVVVTAWTDGRAWLKIRATEGWPGGRLFGDLGPVVRPVRVGDGVVYVAEDGRRIGIHTVALDVVVAGSLPAADLLDVVASVGAVGLTVPDDWAESATGSMAGAVAAVDGLLLPAGLDGFAPPGIRVEDGVATLSYAGPGSRAFLLIETDGTRLPPPFEPDVAAVEMRGTVGRYTPSRGTLEWVEGGLVVTLRSTSLGRAELLAVAQSMEQP